MNPNKQRNPGKYFSKRIGERSALDRRLLASEFETTLFSSDQDVEKLLILRYFVTFQEGYNIVLVEARNAKSGICSINLGKPCGVGDK